MKHVQNFEEFLAENFTLYPSYNNMIGSEVVRNVPITHDVNMSVYGKAYVVDQNGASDLGIDSGDGEVIVIEPAG